MFSISASATVHEDRDHEEVSIRRRYVFVHGLDRTFPLTSRLGVVIFAWMFCMGTQICGLIGLAQGAIGRHAWEISIEKYAFYSRV